MRCLGKYCLTGVALSWAFTSGLAGATDPAGYNLVGTWQCHNPVIVLDHRVVAEDVNYQLFVSEQVHHTFLASYEVEISGFDMAPGAMEAMTEAIPQTDGITMRTTDDGLTFIRVDLTGVIGPGPDQFYIIDHLSDAFKVGVIDSSEHLSYVVLGMGAQAAAHNGYCIRTSRERPEA